LHADHFGFLRDCDSDVLPGARAAHFHAEYQGQQAKFSFDGRMIAGSINSKTARQLIKLWASAHRDELETNWRKMKKGLSLDRIAPLD